MLFQQKVIEFTRGPFKYDVEEIQRRLDNVTASGWELVCVVSPAETTQVLAFIRRPVAPPAELRQREANHST